MAFYEFNEFSVDPERRQIVNNQFLLLGHWLPRRDAETGAGKKQFQLPSLTTRTMPRTRTTFRRISWLTTTISPGMSSNGVPLKTNQMQMQKSPNNEKDFDNVDTLTGVGSATTGRQPPSGSVG